MELGDTPPTTECTPEASQHTENNVIKEVIKWVNNYEAKPNQHPNKVNQSA